MSNTSHEIIQKVLDSSLGGLPPSFEGSPLVFALALFCTMIASLVSLTQVYFLCNEIKKLPAKFTDPINIYRYQLILAYLTILLACGPDAVYLWTYNELSPDTTSKLLLVDRFFDALFLIPFSLFTWLQLRCGAVLRYHLLVRASLITIQPDKSVIRLNLIVTLLILIMSIAVTISK